MDTHNDHAKRTITITDLHKAIEALSISQLYANVVIGRLLEDPLVQDKTGDLADLRAALERSTDRLQQLAELFLEADYGA